MTISEFAVRKKVTVVIMTLFLLLTGLISFSRLPQEFLPQLTFPQVTIVADYANAAPEEIETLITKPIEEAIGSVAGLKRIESISREGRATITVSFNWGQDIDFAALAVREKIDLIKDRFPKEAEDPVVLKFDPFNRPIMIISVTGQNLEPVQMKLLTEKMLKDNLEKVDGVASATLSGGVDREILVEIDQAKLHSKHLSLLEVIEGIEDTNVSYPAGSIKKGLYEYLIRTVGEFRSVREIEYAVAGVDNVEETRRRDVSTVEKGDSGPRSSVSSARQDLQKRMLEQRLILLRDIADVKDTFSERTSVSRYNGRENISISIQKQANANTIELVDNLKLALLELDRDLRQKGLDYEIIYDHSTYIRQSLKNLFSEAVTGGFLAFLVLLFFLRSPGTSLLITLSIPISIIGVFFCMALASIFMGGNGITINIMSLGGLALAVGMIVDSGIVVLENIFRRRQLGDVPDQGAIRGSREVIWPVVASNLTTIAVFFPLIIFVPGIPGQILKDLSWTVIFALIIATIIPLTTVTMFSVYLKIKKEGKRTIQGADFVAKRVIAAKPGEEQNKWLVGIIAVAVMCFIISLMILPTLERETLPKLDQGEFLIEVDLPIGTRLEVTDRVCKKIESVLKEEPVIESVAVTIGAESSKKGEVTVEPLRASQGLILVSLSKDRDVSSAYVVELIRAQLNQVDLEEADINYVLQESEFQFAQGGVKPILIEVKGYEFEDMLKLRDKVTKELKDVVGVFDIQDDFGKPIPETRLNIKKSRAALYGISALDISLTAKAAIDGVVATLYREAGREFDIRVRLREEDRNKIQDLQDLLLYSQVSDTLLPLKEVAEITKDVGPSEIRRSDQERTITISADISKEVSSNLVLAHVKRVVNAIEVPQELRVVFSGKAEEVRENFSMVLFAFLLSVILVYMIMASQFESFLQPLIVMVTVPLSFIGVALALWFTGTSLNVISLFGMVLLAGIVVNNGIVLIEFINQLREEGKELVEAAFEAAKVRARPILMTALTTIIALIPLAIGLGEGAELRRPLAIAIMGGLLSSTFLTLIVVPTFYILLVRLTHKFQIPYMEEEEV